MNGAKISIGCSEAIHALEKVRYLMTSLCATFILLRRNLEAVPDNKTISNLSLYTSNKAVVY